MMATLTIDDQDQWHSGECESEDGLICIEWNVPIRYQNLSYVGHGAYGGVMRATDTKTHKLVAIKRPFRPFYSDVTAKLTYRELKLLQHLNHEDAQIVQLYNVFTPEKTLRKFETLFFVFNFVDNDLQKLIKNRHVFSEDAIQLIIYSLLRGLKFLHSCNIIHRDIAPKNIGVSNNFDVTILDLGLARVVSGGLLTEEVVTPWYRAPEVINNPEHYDSKLDVWSVGCIMAELITLTPLFPGRDTKDQIAKIVEKLGTPTEDKLRELCQEYMRAFILNEIPYSAGIKFKVLFPHLSDQGIDLLEKLLHFDYRERPTAEEALAHPFLAPYHDPEDEPTAPPIIDIHETAEYSVERWEELTWEMIQNFREPAWAFDEH